jgi:hypothetical protein
LKEDKNGKDKVSGVFVMTVPLGFNSFLDEKIENNLFGLSEMLFMKRITKDNNSCYAGLT